eukprot:COSAG06_NODE_4052_length_4625_cov_21.008396_3_plen_147_part_00
MVGNDKKDDEKDEKGEKDEKDDEKDEKDDEKDEKDEKDRGEAPAPALSALLQAHHLTTCASQLATLGVTSVAALRDFDLSKESARATLGLKKLELKRFAQMQMELLLQQSPPPTSATARRSAVASSSSSATGGVAAAACTDGEAAG